MTLEEIHWYLMDWVKRETRKQEREQPALSATAASPDGYMHPEGFYVEGYDGF